MSENDLSTSTGMVNHAMDLLRKGGDRAGAYVLAVHRGDEGSLDKRKVMGEVHSWINTMLSVRVSIERYLEILAEEDTGLRESLARGLEQSANGETTDLGSFIQYTEPEFAMTKAVRDVLDERQKQVDKGYTPDHDDEHTPAQILGYGGIHHWPRVTRPDLVRLAACAIAAIDRYDRGYHLP